MQAIQVIEVAVAVAVVLVIMIFGFASIAMGAFGSWKDPRTKESIAARLLGVGVGHEDLHDGILWRWLEGRRLRAAQRDRLPRD